jgi:hypothetical protein
MFGDGDFERPPPRAPAARGGPAPRRRTTWVSRLQAVQAAVDKQLDTLSKTFPNRKVCLVTFNRYVHF